MGIECAVAWICELDQVRETSPFARTLPIGFIRDPCVAWHGRFEDRAITSSFETLCYKTFNSTRGEMKFHLFIDNFRGFSDAHIPLTEVNFLVGENSTGKTSVLGLLNLFLNS